eukprot:1190359-Prorocentrum_minimum.AAC.1
MNSSVVKRLVKGLGDGSHLRHVSGVKWKFGGRVELNSPVAQGLTKGLMPISSPRPFLQYLFSSSDSSSVSPESSHLLARQHIRS